MGATVFSITMFTHSFSQLTNVRAFRAFHAQRANPGGPFTIVVGAGASAAATSAVDYAIGFAADNANIELDFCHVIDIGQLISNWDRGLGDYSIPFDEARSKARDVAQRVCKHAEDRGIRAVVDVRYGNAADEIIEFAERSAADLIAIGNQPCSRLRRVIYGSVRDRFVRRAATPVLLATASTSALPEFRPQRILVPSADAPDNASAVAFAQRFADVAGAELIFMRATRSPASEFGVIARFARDLEPDLIVVSRPPRSLLHDLAGTSVVDRVLSEIDIPLIVVPQSVAVAR